VKRGYASENKLAIEQNEVQKRLMKHWVRPRLKHRKLYQFQQWLRMETFRKVFLYAKVAYRGDQLIPALHQAWNERLKIFEFGWLIATVNL
jgi:hypothetical protein